MVSIKPVSEFIKCSYGGKNIKYLSNLGKATNASSMVTSSCKPKILQQEARTQQYYDQLAKEWNLGASYFNPRTGNSVYTDNRITCVLQGELPENFAKKPTLGNMGKTFEILKIDHRMPSETIVHRRIPGKNIMPFFTTANSYEQCYRGISGGLRKV